MKDLNCICFGSIILDYRKKIGDVSKKTSKPLKLIDKPINFTIGGISILAIILQRMGFNAAIAGQAGKDIIGYGIKTYLRKKHKINTEGIKLTDYPTSYSIINLTDKERYIQHNIGANAFLRADREVISFIKKNKPALVAIGYSGLLPELDSDNGTKMAELITELKSAGIKTVLDTHTMNGNYSMLDKPLRDADIFFCNEEEAKHISGEEDTENMLESIANSYLKDNDDRYRVFGITLPHGVYIIYGRKGVFDKGFVESRWYTNKPKDLTGAGDAFRAGFCAYLTKNIESFDKGAFDWRSAGMLGNLTASVMVTEGYSGIKNYTNMLERSKLS